MLGSFLGQLKYAIGFDFLVNADIHDADAQRYSNLGVADGKRL